MPYTYYVYHKPTGQHYYGSRWAKNSDPADLWVTYFTSSKHVKNLIDRYGADSFNFEVRKVFETKEQARDWEYRVLTRLGVRKRSDWLNRTDSRIPDCTGLGRKGQGKGRVLSDHHRKMISAGRTGIKRAPFSEEYRQKLSLAGKGRKHSNTAKDNMCLAQRKSKPKYTFTNCSESFVGCMIEWAEHYGLNVRSAATMFCSGKVYKGWTRS